MSGVAFDRFNDDDVRALIAEYPLAWTGPETGPAAEYALLPMLGEYDAVGRLTHVFGHMSRANPLFASLSAQPRATFLFRGPQAYVSPEHAGRRDWAPTWNYAQLRIAANVVFVPDETYAAIERLTASMEQGRPDPWQTSEIGDRLEPMMRRIVAFRAEVTAMAGKFKLGQDETPETLRAILAATDDPAMRRWVERFNRGRLR